MIWLISYLVLLAVVLVWNHGAHRKPTPRRRG